MLKQINLSTENVQRPYLQSSTNPHNQSIIRNSVFRKLFAVECHLFVPDPRIVSTESNRDRHIFLQWKPAFVFVSQSDLIFHRLVSNYRSIEMTSLNKAGSISFCQMQTRDFSAKYKYKADICLSKQAICSCVYLILIWKRYRSRSAIHIWKL